MKHLPYSASTATGNNQRVIHHSESLIYPMHQAECSRSPVAAALAPAFQKDLANVKARAGGRASGCTKLMAGTMSISLSLPAYPALVSAPFSSRAAGGHRRRKEDWRCCPPGRSRTTLSRSAGAKPGSGRWQIKVDRPGRLQNFRWCPDLKTELPKRSASCPNSQPPWSVQPLRIGDNPRSGQIRTPPNLRAR